MIPFEVENLKFKPTPMTLWDWGICIGFSYLFLFSIINIQNFILSPICFMVVLSLWNKFCNRRMLV